MSKALADGRIAQEMTVIEALPAGTNLIGSIDLESASGLTYLGQQAITMNSASQALTLPTGANFVEISAESGAVYYTINATASANSGGYVPEDQVRYLPKVENLTSLQVYGVSPAIAHVNYYQEP